MFYLGEVLVLLWCTACAQAACSICVVSGSESIAECQQSHIIHRLSDLVLNECLTVHIYLTSGTHILTENITFSDSVEETAIHGARHGKPSIIECWNKIRFSKNETMNRVLVSNIVLTHCYSRITDGEKKNQAALYLKNALVTLHSMVIQNTEGYGLYVRESSVEISNCTFYNNTYGHIRVLLESGKAFVTVNNTKLLEGASNGGILLFMSERVNCTFTILNCEFRRNKGSHLLVRSKSNSNAAIIIYNCSFIASNTTSRNTYGILMEFYPSAGFFVQILMQESNFISSSQGVLLIINADYSEIRSCSFTANNKSGILINATPRHKGCNFLVTNCTFQRNRGISVESEGVYNATIRNCTFESNNNGVLHIFNVTHVDITGSIFNSNGLNGISIVSAPSKTVIIRNCFIYNNTGTGIKIEGNGIVILDNSTLQGNQGIGGDCSALRVRGTKNFTLKDMNITDNHCTGIKLSASWVRFEGSVNLIRNVGLQGGALLLKSDTFLEAKMFSKIMFTKSSRLSIINNTANAYGGGIYSDETCDNRDNHGECFFQLRGDYTLTKALTFSGNRANLGGDLVFGGCLSNCSVSINKTTFTINKQDRKNTLWDLLFLQNTLSQSTFVEYPKRIAFCANKSTPGDSGVTCSNDSHTISAYWGEPFSVPLMVVNDFCYPSVQPMRARVDHERIYLKHGSFQQSTKECGRFSYVMAGGSKPETITVKIDLEYLSSDTSAALLTVHLKGCPIGFEISEEICDCMEKLDTYKIGCHLQNYSLEIPGRTWVGVVGEARSAVQIDCHFCKNEGKQTIARFAENDSDLLCIGNRHGIMCGACTDGHSLLLGSYECADCSKSTHIGVLLLIAFTTIGVALVMLLLGLNLTVSTGMINGLIFYSNTVYLNSDALLPTTRESNTHLQNTVKLLSTFQAWMNLDFGITTCFFEGYDAYISTWMQFVFPLYIWLLILIIVLASRYSNRISRITKSNTVPVLATLLLLAYAKLLKTAIEGITFTEAEFLNGSSAHRVWILNGNIPYLKGKHTPLFLMSLLTVVAYILPFTLLIFLGPLLQARSHYRLLSWVYRLKPFLDAFYGPYTSRYRYWPGILLLVRLSSYSVFMIYTPNERLFKLVSIVVMVAVLFVTWMVIGKTRAISLHQTNGLKTRAISLHQTNGLNYLELFFLMNLGVFAAASIYITQFTDDSITSQHGLAVVMVGSVLAVLCGILAYQVFCAVRAKFNIKLSLPEGRPKENLTLRAEDASIKPTHSLVEMAECAAPSDELREPLLVTQ